MDSATQCRCRKLWWDPRFILLLALLLRGGVLYALRDNLRDDPDAYRQVATNLVENGTFGFRADGQGGVAPTAYRAPLYPILLAGCIALGGNAIAAVGLLHLALGVATVGLTLAVGRRLRLPDRAAAVAALLVAADPILLFHSTQVMTETLATFLVALTIFFLLRARRSAGAAALAGASFALAALCRPEFYLAMAAAAWVLLLSTKTWQGKSRLVGAYAAAGAALVMPWVVRNAIQLGAPIAATTHGGYTLWLANNPSFFAYLRTAAPGEVWRDAEEPARTLPGALADWTASREMVEDRAYYRGALQAIGQEPGTFLYAALVRAGRLWQLVPHRLDAHASPLRDRLRYAVGIWYAVVLMAAVGGAWTLGRKLALIPWVWGTVICASSTLVHLVYWSNMRMRAPLMVPVCLLATIALVRWANRRRPVAKPVSP